ncbi:MAG: Ig-like domain-containing protein [Chloroflexota bacterium]
MHILRWLSRLWTGALLITVLLVGLVASLRLIIGLPLFSERPALLTTVPESGTVGVATRSQTTLQFSVPMNPHSVERSIHIEPATPVDFRWNEDRTTLTISPTDSLQADVAYTLMLQEGAQGRLFRPLEETEVLAFRTAPAPTVMTVLPANNTGDIALDTLISVHFSRPIIAETNVRQSATLPALQFDPPIDGSVTWVDQSTALFRPVTPLRPSTRYRATINANLTDVTGEQLNEPFTWSFDTSTPDVLTTIPENNAEEVVLTSPAVVRLSQPVDPSTLQSSLAISPSITGAFSTTTAIDNTQIITFTPDSGWEPATTYTASLQTQSTDMSAPSTQPYEWQFQTAPQPSIVGRFPGDGQTLQPSQDIRLVFSTPVDAPTVESAIQFTPPIDELRVVANDTEARIFPELQAATEYTLTVSADLIDRNGVPLDQEYQFRLRTSSASPQLALPDVQQHTIQLNSNEEGILLQRTNISSLNLDLYALNEAAVVRTFDFNEQEWRSFNPSQVGQSRIRSWSVSLSDDPRDTLVESRLQLLDQDDQPLPSGTYYLRIRSPEGPRADLLVIISNTGIVFQQTDTAILVWVTDQDNGSPVNDASVAVYRDGALVRRGTTNESGVWRLTQTRQNRNQTYVAVANGERPAVVSTAWQANAPAQVEQTNYRVFFALHQPTYTVGETVRLSGFVRSVNNAENRLPPRNLQGTLTLRTPVSNAVLYEENITVSETGSINLDFDLPDDLMIGNYILTLRFGGETFTKPLAIKAPAESSEYIEIVPPPQPVAGVETPIEITTTAPNGLPLPGIGISWTLTADYAPFPELDGYHVGVEDASDVSFVNRSGKGQTNAEGTLTVALTETTQLVNTPIRYALSAQTQHRPDAVSEDTTTFVVAPSQLYVGMRLSSQISTVQQNQQVELLTRNLDGTPALGTIVQVEVLRMLNGQEQSISAERVETDADGQATLPITFSLGGTYRVVASVTDAAGGRMVTSSSVWVTAPGFTEWADDLTEPLQLVSDRSLYEPGDAVSLLATTPFDEANAIISLQQGDTFSETVRVIRPGDLIPIQLEAGNVDPATVSIVLADTNNTNADNVKHATATILMNGSSSTLDVAISSDLAAYAPGDTSVITINTTNAEGEGVPADVILGVSEVPASVQQDIFTVFHDAMATGISTTYWENHSARVQETPTTGQAPLTAPDTPRERPEFADWNGVLRTDDSGVLTTTVHMPQQAAMLNLEAWAAHNTDDFGQSTHQVTVLQPFELTFAAPTFLRVGDTFDVVARLQNNDTISHTAEVQLTTTGVRLQSEATQEVPLAAGEQAQIQWTVVVEDARLARFLVNVRADDRPTISRRTSSLILFPSGGTHTQQGALIQGQDRFQIDRFQIDLPQSQQGIQQRLVIGASPTAGALAQYLIQRLTNQPERSTLDEASRLQLSSVFSNTMTIDRVLPEQLEAMQQRDGGWGWWSETSSDLFMTTAALEALAPFQHAGGNSDRVIERGLDALQQQLQASEYSPDMRAYTQYVLSLYQQQSEVIVQNLVDNHDDLGAEGLSYLLLTNTLNSTDEARLLDRLAAQSVRNTDGVHWPASEDSTFVSTNIRATAVSIRALQNHQSNRQLLDEALQYLVEHRGVDGWENSNTSTHALAALNTFDMLDTSANSVVYMNGESLIEHTDGSHTGRFQRIAIPFEQLESQNELTATGTLLLSYDLQTTEVVTPTSESGVYLLREYVDPQSGQILNLANLQVGQYVEVRIVVIVTEPQHFVSVVSPLPSSARLTGVDTGPFDHMLQEDTQLTFSSMSLTPGIYEQTYTFHLLETGNYPIPPLAFQRLDGSVRTINNVEQIDIAP